MGGWTWKFKATVVDNFTELVVAALLVAAVGGYLTYTASGEDRTETVVRQTSSWESSGEFTHQATVVNDTVAFDEGTVLRNRSVYFRRVTPVLNGSFLYGYRASNSGRLDANTSVVLRYQSVAPDSDGERTVYWRVERPLNESAATLDSGERARTPFSVNVSSAIAEADRIDAQLGGTPGEVQVTIVARVRLTGTRNGQPVETTRQYQTELVGADGTYSVRNDGPRTIPGNQTTRETVPVEPDPLRNRGGPALLVVGLLGLGWLGAVRWTDHFSVTDAQRELSGYQSERDEFDEWITTGMVPESTFEKPRIEVDSLAGLVDVAIDSECRVIEDTERDVFVVIAEGYRYMYYPPRGTALVDDSEESDAADAAGESAVDDEPDPSADDDSDPATDAATDATQTAGADGETDESDEDGVTDDPAEDGETEEPDEDGVTDDPAEDGETEEPDDGETDESGSLDGRPPSGVD